MYNSISLDRYPTRTQYTTVVNGILKRLGIEYDEKTAVSKGTVCSHLNDFFFILEFLA